MQYPYLPSLDYLFLSTPKFTIMTGLHKLFYLSANFPSHLISKALFRIKNLLMPDALYEQTDEYYFIKCNSSVKTLLMQDINLNLLSLRYTI